MDDYGPAKKYVIVSLDDGGDLRWDNYDTREEVDAFLEENCKKAIVVRSPGPNSAIKVRT